MPKRIDALKPGQMGRLYRVATFPRDGKPGRFEAYTRIYNEQWEGCMMFEVMAASGKEAKRAAIQARKSIEPRPSSSPGGTPTE